MYEHWQFYGYPPVERVFEGTTNTSSGYSEHFTAGCSGTGSFLKNVLRTVNIPVSTSRSFGGHTTVSFTHDSINLIHGDDPYGIIDELNDFEIPVGEILLTDQEFDSLRMLYNDIEFVHYTSLRINVHFLPLGRDYFSCDSNVFFTNVKNDLMNLHFSESDTFFQNTMQRARARYADMDCQYYETLKYLKRTFPLWYKMIYGYDSIATVDTVLMPYQIGTATVCNNIIILSVPDSIDSVSPVFITSEDAHPSILPDSVLDISREVTLQIFADDWQHYNFYYLKKNPDYFSERTVSLCHGDSSFAAGMWQKESGTYYDTTFSDCWDSIIVTDLLINPVYALFTDTSICKGEKYFAGNAWQTEGGTYVDSFLTNMGCDSIIITRLALNNLPFLYLGEDTIINQSDSIMLATNNLYPDLLWSTGDTTCCISFKGRDLGPGQFVFWLRATNDQGCRFTDTIHVTVIESSNNVIEFQPGQVRIYASPTFDNLTIETRDIQNEVSVDILSRTGVTVKSKTFGTGMNLKEVINLSGLTPGLYIIKVSSGQFTKIQKFVIIR